MTLVRVSPSVWPVCPGDDVVYKCSSNRTQLPFLFWQEKSPGHVSKQIVTNSLHINNSTGNFTINVISLRFTAQMEWVVVSTATLRGAFLSHNNLTIECSNVSVSEGLEQTVEVAGYCHHNCMHTLLDPKDHAFFSYIKRCIKTACSYYYHTHQCYNSTADMATSIKLLIHLHSPHQ